MSAEPLNSPYTQLAPIDVPPLSPDTLRRILYPTICTTCRLGGTPMCPLGRDYEDPAKRFALVAGAYPWDCIFCLKGLDGKPIDTFSNDRYTWALCPHLRCKEQTGESVEKWGCPKLDPDGRHGEFCPHAVRRIILHRENYPDGTGCDRYEWAINSDHAYGLWANTVASDSPMRFKAMREFARAENCETLYDLFYVYTDSGFKEFCREHKYSVPRDMIATLNQYAEIYGWLRVKDHYRKCLPYEQNIRVAKALAIQANTAQRKGDAK